MKPKFVVHLCLVAGLILSAAGCKREMSLNEVVPAGGAMAGGEVVTIKGAGFKTGGTIIVYFGSRRAPHSYIEGTDKIVVTTPAYAESTLVDVRVIDETGREIILKKAYMYLKAAKWSPLDAFGSKKQ